MVESDSLVDKFHKLEKACVGYEDFINATEANYLKTLDGLKEVVKGIQS
jgi:hypothetical protein